MKLSNHGPVPVYTISGSSTARPLPEWLARKRKRSLKQDPEYANRIELLQDFEFEEASSCIRISDDGDWVVSTGTYKPQIHVHYLPHLSLSFARHTNSLNQSFILLSSDYSKSLHLQTDRSIEFHTPQGCHYSIRIPRYGRDLKYDKTTAEALIPSVGVDPTTQSGEVYRLNLELGRFMKPYAIDVGGDDGDSLGTGALQGGINAGSVNTCAVAETSHNLLAFGTSLGTVEFWDSRSRSRVGVLPPPRAFTDSVYPAEASRAEITALEFHHSGLNFATGSSNGLIHLYDLRSPAPLLKKDQGYGFPVHTLDFLSSPSRTTSDTPLILSSDKRIIKIWDQNTGAPWTHVEAAVDLNSVAWCKDSGMLLTANEGRQQHSFFIPQLGPAPRWCSFLDNLVEEMAEDASDPNAYSAASGGIPSSQGGEVYDNYKFVTLPDLKALNLEDKIGSSLLKPYMHGYFLRQELYEEARILAQPDLWALQRQKSIRDKIEKERESRIRGSKKAVTAKVNRQLAEKMQEREDKNERRKARRALRKADGDEAQDEPTADAAADGQDRAGISAGGEDPPPITSTSNSTGNTLLHDPRFASLFQDEDFAIDESSFEFHALNPSTATAAKPSDRDSDPSTARRRGLTAAEEEDLARRDGADKHNDNESSASGSGSDNSTDDDDAAAEADTQKRVWGGRQAAADNAAHDANGDVSYQRRPPKPGQRRQTEDRRGGPPRRGQLQMRVSSSSAARRGGGSFGGGADGRERSFGARMARLGDDGGGIGRRRTGRAVEVGEKEVTFAPAARGGRRGQMQSQGQGQMGGGGRRAKDRRSASGNTMRNL